MNSERDPEPDDNAPQADDEPEPDQPQSMDEADRANGEPGAQDE